MKRILLLWILIVIFTGCASRSPIVNRETLIEIKRIIISQREEMHRLREQIESMEENHKKRIKELQAAAERKPPTPRPTERVKPRPRTTYRAPAKPKKYTDNGVTRVLTPKKKPKPKTSVPTTPEEVTESEITPTSHPFTEFIRKPEKEEQPEEFYWIKPYSQDTDLGPRPPFTLYIWILVRRGKVYKHRMEPFAYPGDVRKLGHEKTKSGTLVTLVSTYDPNVRWKTLLPKPDGKYKIEARREQ